MQASDPLRAKREAEVGKAIRGAPTSQSPVRPATFMSSKTTKPLSSSESWHSLAQEGLYQLGRDALVASTGWQWKATSEKKPSWLVRVVRA